MDFELIFSHPFDALAQMEAQARGYLSHVKVKLADGQIYALSFYDPVRLAQDLEEEGFIAEVGLVVVKEVTLHHMQAAIEVLTQTDFFQRYRPVLD